MTALAVIRSSDRRHEVELGFLDAQRQWYAKCVCGWIEIFSVQKLAESAGFGHIKSNRSESK